MLPTHVIVYTVCVDLFTTAVLYWLIFKRLILLLTFEHVKCSECCYSMSSTMMDWEKGKEKYKCLVLYVVNI